MILKKNSPVFEATDGSKFLDLADAEKHQIAIDVQKIYENSVNNAWIDIDLKELIELMQRERDAFRLMFAQLNVTG